jgi:hypothetical protein
LQPSNKLEQGTHEFKTTVEVETQEVQLEAEPAQVMQGATQGSAKVWLVS